AAQADFTDAMVSTNAWHTYELHFTSSDTAELYIDGGSALATGAGDSHQARKITLGMVSGGTDPDSIIYIRNVKVGTTQGASDLFADDFSGGDLSNWTTTIGTC